MITAQETFDGEIIVENFAGGVRSGAGQPAGVVRRDDHHNGAAAGLRGGVKGESI